MRVLFFLAALAGFVYFGVNFYNERKQEISLNIPSGYAPAAKVAEPTWQDKVAAIAKVSDAAAAADKTAPATVENKPLLPMASLETKKPEATQLRLAAPHTVAAKKQRVVSDMSHHPIARRHHHRRARRHAHR